MPRLLLPALLLLLVLSAPAGAAGKKRKKKKQKQQAPPVTGSMPRPGAKTMPDGIPEPDQAYTDLRRPDLTEEDEHSMAFPEKYRCDSCRAVSFHLHEHYALAEKALPKSKQGNDLLESQVDEAHAAACLNRDFWRAARYGIKQVASGPYSGQAILSGPALGRGSKAAGIVAAGRAWPARMLHLCGTWVDVLEDEVYARYLAAGRDLTAYQDVMCAEMCAAEMVFEAAAEMDGTMAEGWRAPAGELAQRGFEIGKPTPAHVIR